MQQSTSGQSSVRWWVGFVDILSLNEAEVHDFSWLNEWFSNEVQAQKIPKTPVNLILTDH